MDKSEKHENYIVQRGKKLSFIPSHSKNRKYVVNIEDSDLKKQEKYWKIAITG